MRCELKRNLAERQAILTWGAGVRRGAAQDSGPVWLAPGSGKAVDPESESQAIPGVTHCHSRLHVIQAGKPHFCASVGTGARPSTGSGLWILHQWGWKRSHVGPTQAESRPYFLVRMPLSFSSETVADQVSLLWNMHLPMRVYPCL